MIEGDIEGATTSIISRLDMIVTTLLTDDEFHVGSGKHSCEKCGYAASIKKGSLTGLNTNNVSKFKVVCGLHQLA